jgi:hypothetical protein
VGAYTTNTSSKDFDGQVYIALVGEDGTTQEMQLQPRWQGEVLCNPSSTDTFYVSGWDVGRLKEACVRVEKGPSGQPHKWGLGYLSALNTSSGLQAMFEYTGNVSPGNSISIPKTVVIVEYEVRQPSACLPTKCMV